MDRSLQSLLLTGATLSLVVGTYSMASPGIANTRANAPGDATLSAAERSAAWISAGMVGGVALIAKDPTVFALGATTIVVMSWWHRHANQVTPATDRMKSAVNGVLPDAVKTPENAVPAETAAATDDLSFGF